jgi:hypothetical protein
MHIRIVAKFDGTATPVGDFGPSEFITGGASPIQDFTLSGQTQESVRDERASEVLLSGDFFTSFLLSHSFYDVSLVLLAAAAAQGSSLSPLMKKGSMSLYSIDVIHWVPLTTIVPRGHVATARPGSGRPCTRPAWAILMRRALAAKVPAMSPMPGGSQVAVLSPGAGHDKR